MRLVRQGPTIRKSGLRGKFYGHEEKLFGARVLQVMNEHILGIKVKIFSLALAVNDVDDASVVKPRASFAVRQNRPKIGAIMTVKGKTLTRR